MFKNFLSATRHYGGQDFLLKNRAFLRFLKKVVILICLVLGVVGPANADYVARRKYPAEIHYRCLTQVSLQGTFLIYYGSKFTDRASCLESIVNAWKYFTNPPFVVHQPCLLNPPTNLPPRPQSQYFNTNLRVADVFLNTNIPNYSDRQWGMTRSCEIDGMDGGHAGMLFYSVIAVCQPNAASVEWDLTGDEAKATCTSYLSIQDKEPMPQICRATDGENVGNPIEPGSGSKRQYEADIPDNGPFPLTFERLYRSRWSEDIASGDSPLGRGWTHNHLFKLELNNPTNPVNAAIINGKGIVRLFNKSIVGWSASDNADSIAQNTSGTWTYKNSDDDSTSTFSQDGKLLTVVARNGLLTSYAYNADGLLARVENAFGRSLNFSYDSAKRLVLVTNSDLRSWVYAYDSNARLSSVTYPDGKSRSYVYEDGNFPYLLTGIFDESGSRYSTYVYGGDRRAISTELAGGVQKYQVEYPYNSPVKVTDPLGTVRQYTYGAWKYSAVLSASLPSNGGNPDAASRTLYNGFIFQETDFNGIKTSYDWDQSRRLPISITEAIYLAEQRVKNIQWHPQWSLPEVIKEPGRTTTYTYDGAGQRQSQTVLDTQTGTTRTWNWTYTLQGLVNSAKEPNGAVTSYTYDPRGNVLTSTNALGHVTSYAYDLANRVTSQTEPNGLVTTYTYDARDRLLTQTVGGQQTTTLTYKPYGSVETITLPTGLVLTYTYDPAHRLTGWSNNRGESGSFTLDGMGNRTAEQIKDSSGAVAWNAARTINNINRVSGKTEGPNQTSSFGYDANGDLTRSTNGLNQSTQLGLDNLRRVASVTNAANVMATLKYNALDAVTEAKDFKGVATGYTRDAQGNATTESSADTGGATTQYDNLGLPSQIVDALGQATTINRDPLGRPTSLVFADGKTTTLRYDLTASSKGYLSEIVDRSGTTEYTRDAFGRVVLKKQTLANGSVQQIGYAYNLNGTLGSIAYPTGATLSHVYDATGRLTGLNWNSTPLVSNIAWNPLGQPTGWTWAFTSTDPKLKATRSYDTAGRMTATEFSSYVYDAAGRITSLTQNLYGPADTDPAHDTIANASTTWNVGYDSVGRITSFNVAGSSSNTAGFGYDANGNRSSSTRVVNGLSTSRSYTVPTNGNRLTGFSQTTGGATTSVVYGYNANGDLTGDGLRSYGYDAEGRLSTATTGATDSSPTTRYAHNALGQRLFKTEPVYPPSQGDESDPGFWGSLVAFFTKMWSPSTSQAEQLGYAYVYDERGTLVAEIGSGGTNSSGQTSYIYLPTANGPMPVAAVINGNTYAVHSDHLNTPRRLSNEMSQPVWQWRYSAFGEEEPTTAAKRFTGPETVPSTGATSTTPATFNLRYPGQYADVESGLFYNGFRTYIPIVGRYTQGDPIGLGGGWNRFGYVSGDPVGFVDPEGLQQSRMLRPLENQLLEGGGGGFGVGGGSGGGGMTLGMIGGMAAAALGVGGAIGPSGDYSPWSPDKSVNDDFLKDRDRVKDLDTPPAPYQNPQDPECEEIRRRIKHYDDAIKARENFTSRWYGGLLNAGHAYRIGRLKSERDKLQRRLDRGDCKC